MEYDSTVLPREAMRAVSRGEWASPGRSSGLSATGLQISRVSEVMDTAETVRRFVAGTFLFDANGNLAGSQSLLDSGVIDSTGVLELVLFLEQTFQIKVADKDLVPENLDTIDNIARFVERNRLEASSLRWDVA